MTRRGWTTPTLMATLATLVAATAHAQVGHLPERSPYRDLDGKHEWTAVVGVFRASRDVAGVAPRDGLLTGIQYQWRPLGGFHMGFDLSRIASRRTVIDPEAALGQRALADRDWPLWSLDGTANLALTGPKSWHGLVPMVRGGLGLISDFRSEDVGGFRFGTRFAFSFGGGVRWVPGGNLQLRADVTDRMYTISYPDSYFVSNDGVGSVLSPVTPSSRWMHNPALTIGVSYYTRR